MALLVIIGHVRGAMTFVNDTLVGSLLSIFAWPALSMFFFLTGYGLRESFAKKENYAQTFLKRRVVPYYLKYLIFLAIYIIYYFVSRIGTNWSFDWKLFGLSFVWGGTYIDNGWYLQTTLLIYIVFWLAYLPKWNVKYTYSVLGLALVGYVAMCMLLGGFYPYYTQFVLCVPFGFLWSMHYEKIDKLANKFYWLIILVALAVVAGTIVLARIVFANQGYLQTVTIMLCSLFICVVCLMLIKKVPIKCKVTNFLGEVSLEIYVVHGMFLWIFSKIFDGGIQNWGQAGLYFLLVLACTIPLAWALHRLLSILDKKVFKKW